MSIFNKDKAVRVKIKDKNNKWVDIESIRGIKGINGVWCGKEPPPEGDAKYRFWVDPNSYEKYDQLHLPLGYVYVQFPGKLSPLEMDFYGKWEILDGYNGAFFRSESKNNYKFNSKEEKCLAPRVIRPSKESDFGINFYCEAGASYSSGGGNTHYGASCNSKYYDYALIPKFTECWTGIKYKFEKDLLIGINEVYKKNSDEIRPKNYTIRLWKRTK